MGNVTIGGAIDGRGIASTTFGVCLAGGFPSAVLVPIDDKVRGALNEMLTATLTAFERVEGDWRQYEAAEQYASSAKVYVPLKFSYMQQLTDLRSAKNMEVSSDALADPSLISAYFATFVDQKKRKVVAVRRATQFKATLGARNRLVRMVDDTLQILDDPVFKLNSEFDLIIGLDQAWVLHPAALEAFVDLDEAIRVRVGALSKDLLGGHPKSGHQWTPQNRPPRKRPGRVHSGVNWLLI